MKAQRQRCIVIACAFLPVVISAQIAADVVIHQIKLEESQHSQVMEYAFNLTERYGPRFTGSPNFRAAGDWAVKELEKIGLASVHQERIPSYGAGWSCERFAAHQLAPTYAPLTGIPLVRSSSTNGPVVGDAILTPQLTELEYQKFVARFKGKLKGAVFLEDVPSELALQIAVPLLRYTEQDLVRLSIEPDLGPRRPRPAPSSGESEADTVWKKLNQLLIDEGVSARVRIGAQPNDLGVMTATAASGQNTVSPPTFVLQAEQYNRIARLLQRDVPVRLEVEIGARFYDNTPDAFSVIADLPGSQKAAEIVMIGAHLDSWTGGTGATDNAAGCAISIEAMRLLKNLGPPLQRTVRLALWGAEEQGAFGSRAYVNEHFFDIANKTPKPDYAKVSGYFNLDFGAGKIRGIFLQGNDAARPIFESWLAPLRSLGASTVSPQTAGGSDHVSFEQVGLPAFPFIQDELGYHPLTHHTNMDTFDRLQPSDLRQAAAVVASILYQAAMSDQGLPHK
jgi:carboxypeptidase Q